MAYQFHREDMKQGMVMAFRRSQSKDDSKTIRLRGLLPEASYEVTFEDNGATQAISGEELLSGINVAITEVPGSFLITYKLCE
jgi:hypothetical protein